MGCFHCNESLNELPECTCDGPGFCPVYNIKMNQHNYDRCKNDKLWRRNYHHFFGIVNDPTFQAEVKVSPQYKTIERQIEKQRERLKLEKEAREEYRRERQNYIKEMQQDENRYDHAFYRKYLNLEDRERWDSWSDENKDEYLKAKWEAVDKAEASQAERQQLDKVVEALEEEGVNLETYQDKRDGLGTVISNVLNKLGVTEDKIEAWSGIEGCGCEKRKKFLNKIFPFRKKELPLG